MSGFIEGQDRKQATLFPDLLDDFVSEENPVRVIDVFVDELDLSGLGFKTTPAETGRPGYHPATLLKLYIYGYLNQVQSSRRLEREAQRNVELMWLTQRLAPDFKTIADFRRDHGKAIRRVCQEFVSLCRKLGLFDGADVAIDSSKFKAVNNRDRNFSRGKVKGRRDQIADSIDRYLRRIAAADRHESKSAKAKVARLREKIGALKEETARLNEIEKQMLAAPDEQISFTDPDARSMMTSGRGSALVGYNVHTAVDTKNHLVLDYEVTNLAHERKQLFNMSQKAREAMGVENLTAVADRGYFRGEELLACDQAGITAYLPIPKTSSGRKNGRFTKEDFIYIAADNEYLCPAGERLIWRFETEEGGMRISKYWSSNCPRCQIRSQCSTSNYRRVSRWEHEDVVERAEARLDEQPERMTQRRQTVEHVYGTLKAWMGYTHFQMKTKKHVGTEMSLHVLAYNIRRMLTIFGTARLIEAIRA